MKFLAPFYLVTALAASPSVQAGMVCDPSNPPPHCETGTIIFDSANTDKCAKFVVLETGDRYAIHWPNAGPGAYFVADKLAQGGTQTIVAADPLQYAACGTTGTKYYLLYAVHGPGNSPANPPKTSWP